MARTSVANTIERIRRQLASGQRDEVNTLSGDHDANGTTLTFTYDIPNGLRTGAIVCCGLESMRVMSTDAATRTAKVIRGWQDSEPEAHVNASEAWINPRFQPMDIFEGIRDEISSWGPELFDVAGTEVVSTYGQDTLELPTELAKAYGIIEVRSKINDLSYAEPSAAWPRLGFRIQRGAGTSWSGAATSGASLRFTDHVSGGPLHVLVAMPFDVTALTPDADLVDTVHLHPSMLDVVDKGVQFRLLMEAENSRGSRMVQDEPRNTAETPWGAGLQSIQLVNAIYRRRKTEEAMKLAARYPYTGV